MPFFSAMRRIKQGQKLWGVFDTTSLNYDYLRDMHRCLIGSDSAVIITFNTASQYQDISPAVTSNRNLPTNI